MWLTLGIKENSLKHLLKEIKYSFMSKESVSSLISKSLTFLTTNSQLTIHQKLKVNEWKQSFVDSTSSARSLCWLRLAGTWLEVCPLRNWGVGSITLGTLLMFTLRKQRKGDTILDFRRRNLKESTRLGILWIVDLWSLGSGLELLCRSHQRCMGLLTLQKLQMR